MILPIVAFGDPVLKKKAVDIDADYPNLQTLIDNMYQTMENASGVGLAAPQIGLAIRLFIVDASPMEDEQAGEFSEVFINAVIEEERGELWKYNEGCLSIPGVREDVYRHPDIKITYFDRHFVKHTKHFNGIVARIIQHEYDHIEGVLFTDRISMLRKRVLKNRLSGVSKGMVDVDYKMRFPIKR